MKAADTLRRLVDHRDVTDDDLVFPFIMLAGDEPNSIQAMLSVLPSGALNKAKRNVHSAPTNDDEWGDFRVAQAECDSELMTRQYRAGVKAIRAYMKDSPGAFE